MSGLEGPPADAGPVSLDPTDDKFLGGDLAILQPRRGFRAGLDAVMLASSVTLSSPFNGRILDVGAGVGTAGLCVARRLPQARVVLLECQQELLQLAEQNIARNHLGGRVSAIEADIGSSDAALAEAGLEREQFDATIANPPFHDARHGTRSAVDAKAIAHTMGPDGLDRWCRFLATVTRPGGTATMIHKAEALSAVLAGMDRRFGELTVLPISARAGEPAIRVLVRGLKGSRAALRLLSPLVLHEVSDSPTVEADRVLRAGSALGAIRADWFSPLPHSK